MVGGYPIPGWGVPQPGLDGRGYPIQVWRGTPSQGVGGYPSQVLMVGVPWVPPNKTWLGYPPPIQTWTGYPPPSKPGWGTLPPSRPGWGTPPPPTIKTWMKYPPYLDLTRVHPPPPPRCRLTNKLKTVPSPIFRMRAVKLGIYFCS